jgi:hypothetical protein
MLSVLGKSMVSNRARLNRAQPRRQLLDVARRAGHPAIAVGAHQRPELADVLVDEQAEVGRLFLHRPGVVLQLVILVELAAQHLKDLDQAAVIAEQQPGAVLAGEKDPDPAVPIDGEPGRVVRMGGRVVRRRSVYRQAGPGLVHHRLRSEPHGAS